MNDKPIRIGSGWTMLPVTIFALPALILGFNPNANLTHDSVMAFAIGVGIILLGVCWVISLAGYFIVNPNEARVLQLFGEYVGTVRDTGFFFGNPFYTTGTWTVETATGQFGSIAVGTVGTEALHGAGAQASGTYATR